MAAGALGHPRGPGGRCPFAFVDERELWPQFMFPTASLVARGDYARAQAARLARTVDVLGDEVERALRQPEQTRTALAAELARVLGKALPAGLLEASWPYVDFTCDIMPDAFETLADDAFVLGLAPRTSCKTLFV